MRLVAPRAGTLASVEVSVDIAHTYRDDLVVALLVLGDVAPHEVDLHDVSIDADAASGARGGASPRSRRDGGTGDRSAARHPALVLGTQRSWTFNASL